MSEKNEWRAAYSPDVGWNVRKQFPETTFVEERIFYPAFEGNAELLAETLNALARERDEAVHRLRNLLAVVHRDGGHYATAHGDFEATEDAIQIVLHERSERDEAVRERDELRTGLWRTRYTLADLIEKTATEHLGEFCIEYDKESCSCGMNDVFAKADALLVNFDPLPPGWDRGDDQYLRTRPHSLTTDKAAQETKDGEG